MRNRLEIIHEDDDLLVVNKPAGLLSIPDRYVPDKPNLQDILKNQFGDIWVVHRLDKDTSGLLCFGKTEAAHKSLSRQFEERTVKKLYHALVDGKPGKTEGQIDRPIASGSKGKMLVARQGKAALTLYKVLQQFKHCSWVEIDLKTGRTHQIRVHFQAIGHPLLVDPLYGRRTAFFLSEIKGKKYRLGKAQEERPLISRVSLHASVLQLQHPSSQEVLKFEAPIPKDLNACLKQLTKWST